MSEVAAVSARRGHHFSKDVKLHIRLLAGLGVEGDGHCGEKVKHRSRARFNPDQPNLRQVHLIHGELFDELAAMGFDVKAGDLGENVLTRGIDLLGLPEGTRLRLGPDAVIEITGLRNPCSQINDFKAGLMQAVIGRDADGQPVLKAGIMSIVREGGLVTAGDAIVTELPPLPHRALKRV